MFEPRFTLIPKIAKALMAIEADRQAVAGLPITAPMLDSLRRTAQLLATHYSTQIEGNRLSRLQVESVIAGEGRFPGRERDEAEVRHYFAALEFVERAASDATPISETLVRTIHGLVMTGRAKPTRYRAGQNVIRDARTGRTVYLPPEAHDVPKLMKELVAWIRAALALAEWPAPIIAGLAHYQFATIHPYFDGNGRTARLLTNLILHCSGYGLKGIYSLEEYYSTNLDGYYSGLAVGSGHNYYSGRAEADVTGFLEYFCTGMTEAFGHVRQRAEEASRVPSPEQSAILRALTPQQRRVLGLFQRSRVATSKMLAAFFRITPRAAGMLCRKWTTVGFLVVEDSSTKSRSYRLAPNYETLVGVGRVD